jgi:mono/diheme cytochrome c family protein
MRRFVVITALAAAACLAGEIRAQDGPKSVWGGVYAEAQAERGKAAYATSCAMCHGPDLAGGGEAPALTGPTFLSSWNGHGVGELFERTSTTMPLQAPGSLEAAAYADILAYLFKANGFPAGQADLSADKETLGAIRIDTVKPAAGAAPAAPDAKTP